MHNKRVNPCIHITHNKRAHTHNMQLHEQEMARAGSLAPALHALVPPLLETVSLPILRVRRARSCAPGGGRRFLVEQLLQEHRGHAGRLCGARRPPRAHALRA